MFNLLDYAIVLVLTQVQHHPSEGKHKTAGNSGEAEGKNSLLLSLLPENSFSS